MDSNAFYVTGKGTIGHAKVLSIPENKPNPKAHHSEKYPWIFKIGETKLYLDDPKILDLEIRRQLDTFKGIDPNKPWGWVVQATRKISANDFNLVTRH